jgi:hypothetical protein
MPGDLTGHAAGAQCRSLPASSESSCSSTEARQSKLAGPSPAAIVTRVAAIVGRNPGSGAASAPNIGASIDGTTLRVIDAQGTVLSTGAPGELLIYGRSVALGCADSDGGATSEDTPPPLTHIAAARPVRRLAKAPAVAIAKEFSMKIAPSPLAQPQNDDPSPREWGTPVPTFAERLNRLFDTVKPPGRSYFTSGELVNALKANGVGISAPYVSQLRSGNRAHPSASTIEAIAHFFRVDPAYFTDPEYYRLVDRDLTVISAMCDPGVRRVATRVIGLSTHAVDEIVKAVDELRTEARPPQPAPTI